jgi:hypothetical protein
MTWKLYTDEACTQAFSGTLSFVFYSDSPGVPQDKVLYFAEVERDPVNNGAYRRVISGGGNNTFTVTDLDPATPPEVTEVKLAETAAGLDTAIAGGSLSLGPELISGLSGKKTLHIRVTTTRTEPVVTVGLGIDINEGTVLAN